MYQMVIKYLNDYKEKLNDFPGFRDNYDKLSMKREEISDAGRDQSQYTNKKSIEKKALRKKLEAKIVEISLKMEAYAILNKNFTLLANCRYTPWRVTRLTQIDLASKGGSLYNLASENIAGLAEYGIKPDVLKDLKMATDEYYEHISEPRQFVVISTTATKRMALAYKEADEALRFIDIVASLNEKSGDGFYSGYRVMRKQLKSGTVKMALKGQAIDLNTSHPVQNVVFTFILTESVKRKPKKSFKIVKKTKKLGGFKIMHMPKGKYEVVVKKAGFKEQKIELSVGQDLVKMVVEMESVCE